MTPNLTFHLLFLLKEAEDDKSSLVLSESSFKIKEENLLFEEYPLCLA